MSFLKNSVNSQSLYQIFNALSIKILPRHQDPFLQRLNDPLIENKRIALWIRREDIIHKDISGNKWWKLSGTFAELSNSGERPTVITFGGAYSNHLYATAAACEELGLSSVGIVRGEIHEPPNPTLAFCREKGMTLIPVTRSEYRDKKSIKKRMEEKYGSSLFVPEGGTTISAVKACAGIVDNQMRAMDYVCLPVGTGGTFAGILGGMESRQQALGFSALKGDFLNDVVKDLLDRSWKNKDLPDWDLCTDYHFGGYGKISEDLIGFIQQFYQRHGILLDPIYTGKMMYGIFDKIRLGHFSDGSSICAIHTGGLQGWKGIKQRYHIDPSTF
jgi:1-aminocyclopropane-1-carboxylate deaminase/D-cysteine desulfhydrase-like pyridoxal-dependent ACC family enzyme